MAIPCLEWPRGHEANNLPREETSMSDSHHHDHHEDPTVCYRVALILVAVIAVIAIIGVFN